jgi:hypothetical protein
VKSKVSRSFCTGKAACLMRALSTLAARAATSSSVSRSRYCWWLSPAKAASREGYQFTGDH